MHSYWNQCPVRECVNLFFHQNQSCVWLFARYNYWKNTLFINVCMKCQEFISLIKHVYEVYNSFKQRKHIWYPFEFKFILGQKTTRITRIIVFFISFYIYSMSCLYHNFLNFFFRNVPKPYMSFYETRPEGGRNQPWV